jgi:hypothetical protein
MITGDRQKCEEVEFDRSPWSYAKILPKAWNATSDSNSEIKSELRDIPYTIC